MKITFHRSNCTTSCLAGAFGPTIKRAVPWQFSHTAIRKLSSLASQASATLMDPAWVDGLLMRMWILAKMVQMSLVPRYGWQRGKAESDDIIIKDLLQWLAGWTRLLYWAQILHLNLPLSTKKRSVVVESERTQMFSLFSSSLSASWLASSSSSACSTISPQNLEYFLLFPNKKSSPETASQLWPVPSSSSWPLTAQ